jgi:hypothetical protein
LIATHYDLHARNTTDHITHVKGTLKTNEWDHYLQVDRVGKIPYEQILAFYLPEHYAKYLESKSIEDVFNPLCRLNNGPTWSTILNCQTFTRDSINYLGCDFPSSVRIINDCIPTMMDFYIQASLVKANTTIEKQMNSHLSKALIALLTVDFFFI